MRRDDYYPFYGWLLMIGLMVYGAFLLWDFGLFKQLISKDVTYLSSVILILFVLACAYLGFAAWRLSRQMQYSATDYMPGNHGKSLAQEHLKLLRWQRQQGINESETLLARLVEKIHKGHASGWFLSDFLMRLGLIGTVIGFVMMLGTVFQLKENDVDALQQLLGTMGSGMQVALYTTLAGLGSAMLLSIQCQWLDRCADNLVSRILELGIRQPNVSASNTDQQQI